MLFGAYLTKTPDFHERFVHNLPEINLCKQKRLDLGVYEIRPWIMKSIQYFLIPEFLLGLYPRQAWYLICMGVLQSKWISYYPPKWHIPFGGIR